MEELKEYKWAKLQKGREYAAFITLEVIASSKSEDNEVIGEYAGKGFTSQGNFEEVPANGYDSWKKAVVYGLNYGFSKTDTRWTVRVKSLWGRTGICTNPAIVAYTALRAFWARIHYAPSQQETERLENLVFASWETDTPETLIPDFESLTFIVL